MEANLLTDISGLAMIFRVVGEKHFLWVNLPTQNWYYQTFALSPPPPPKKKIYFFLQSLKLLDWGWGGRLIGLSSLKTALWRWSSVSPHESSSNSTDTESKYLKCFQCRVKYQYRRRRWLKPVSEFHYHTIITFHYHRFDIPIWARGGGA